MGNTDADIPPMKSNQGAYTGDGELSRWGGCWPTTNCSRCTRLGIKAILSEIFESIAFNSGRRDISAGSSMNVGDEVGNKVRIRHCSGSSPVTLFFASVRPAHSESLSPIISKVRGNTYRTSLITKRLCHYFHDEDSYFAPLCARNLKVA